MRPWRRKRPVAVIRPELAALRYWIFISTVVLGADRSVQQVPHGDVEDESDDAAVQAAPRIEHVVLHVEGDPAGVTRVLDLHPEKPDQEERPEILVVGFQGLLEGVARRGFVDGFFSLHQEFSSLLFQEGWRARARRVLVHATPSTIRMSRSTASLPSAFNAS